MKNNRKIIIFISGAGSNMEVLINKAQCGELAADVQAVFSDNASAGGLSKATALNILVNVFPYHQPNKHAAEKLILKAVENLAPDYIVLAGFMRLLSPMFVRRYEKQIINIHPSLLPLFKGVNAIKDAFDYGVKVTGVTVHWVNEEMDGGQIIAQEPVNISKADTLQTLAEKIHRIEHQLYWRTLNDIFK